MKNEKYFYLFIIFLVSVIVGLSTADDISDEVFENLNGTINDTMNASFNETVNGTANETLNLIVNDTELQELSSGLEYVTSDNISEEGFENPYTGMYAVGGVSSGMSASIKEGRGKEPNVSSDIYMTSESAGNGYIKNFVKSYKYESAVDTASRF